LANLGSELEKCVGSRVHLVGVSISFEKNFYRLPFTPPSLVRCIGPSRWILVVLQLRWSCGKLSASSILVATSLGLGNDLSRVSSPKGLSHSRSSLLGGPEELDGVTGEWWLAHTLRVPRT
jgi:hypothetical protein